MDGLALRIDQMPEYISQLESSGWFLVHMRDKFKPGTAQHAQFDSELNSCRGQLTRIKQIHEAATKVKNSVSGTR